MAVARWLGHSALTLALLGVVLVLADPARASWGQPVSTEHGSIPAAMLDQSWTPLPGHVLAALPQASPLAAESRLPSEPLVLTIVLNRSDQAAFDAFLREVQDPQSPSFRRFAAQRELAQRFGPSQAVYDGVLAYLQQNGFT